jgi:NAD(P)-dependent dehydrogenase (short-subunit alcohol dehydrogenase family)
MLDRTKSVLDANRQRIETGQIERQVGSSDGNRSRKPSVRRWVIWDSLIFCSINAGGSSNEDGLVTTASLDEFWNRMHVDYFGTFLAPSVCDPRGGQNRGGAVMNMVSVAGFGNLGGGRSAYTSSKAAVMNLARSRAHAFAVDGIRGDAITPTGVATA